MEFFSNTGGSPTAIAIDKNNNIYVALVTSGIIQKTSSDGSTVTTFASGLSNPYGLAFGPDNYLYVANYGNGVVSQIYPNGIVNTFVTLSPSIAGCTFDQNGNLYVSQYDNGTIYKITPSKVITIFATFGFGIIGISINSDGYMFASQNTLNQILKISPDGSSFSVYANLDKPVGNAFSITYYLFTVAVLLNSVYKSIDMACFNHDTKILCLNSDLKEEYIPIQSLKEGDWVKTYLHGYKQISVIKNKTMYNQSDDWNKCMYRMVKNDENGLTEDLIVTGGHSILVDELSEEEQNIQKTQFWGFIPKIDDKQLLLACVSNKFVKEMNNNEYTYYHFAVENDGNDDQCFGVWANGLLVEIPSKNFLNRITI